MLLQGGHGNVVGVHDDEDGGGPVELGDEEMAEVAGQGAESAEAGDAGAGRAEAGGAEVAPVAAQVRGPWPCTRNGVRGQCACRPLLAARRCHCHCHML